jgi:predicted transcriptional regulator of viral defense system
VNTLDFLVSHPVFSLEEAAKALAPRGGRAGTVERLRHHVEAGRLLRVTREVYATVPRGVAVAAFQPDPYLVAVAARPDAIFSNHSALELLGVGHSAFRTCIVFSRTRRRTIHFRRLEVRFLADPHVLAGEARRVGTRKVDRRGRLLQTTGPERTLVEGFRRPDLTGGTEELLRSASAFPTLDLDLLRQVLDRYDTLLLFAAVGWFLENRRRDFHVPEEYLERLEQRKPAAPQYLHRNERGGTLISRWNLIVPDALLELNEPDDEAAR